jgi:two-component system response regulator FlrC
MTQMKVLMIDNPENETRMLMDDHRQHIEAPIAEDPRSRAVLYIAERAAKSQATILITGETGVGKEILANYIHLHSHFSTGPFVSVNCAALPENMIESILFGYEKGAFTNAINTYIGKFEQAQHGTLLLDEISEISVGLQAKLLRVLQEREIERLGGRKMIKINLRIIAATNRNLHKQVEQGFFRKDLYYRLNVMPIECPALRDRRLDIVPLAENFIRHHANAMGRQVPVLTQAAKNKLIDATWPGNIREMDNIIQRTLIMTDAMILDEHDIAFCENPLSNSAALSVNEDHNHFSSPLEANEAKLILDVLKETDGCRNRAATKLNISPRTLRYKISKLRSIGLAIP